DQSVEQIKETRQTVVNLHELNFIVRRGSQLQHARTPRHFKTRAIPPALASRDRARGKHDENVAAGQPDVGLLELLFVIGPTQFRIRVADVDWNDGLFAEQ